jgi:hypothetical protein
MMKDRKSNATSASTAALPGAIQTNVGVFYVACLKP